MSEAPESACERRWLWRRDLPIVGGVIVLAALALAFRQVMAPLAVALALAYVMNPIMRWAERHRLPRPLAATLLFLIVLAVCAAIALFAIPPLVSQLYGLGVAVVGEPESVAAPGYVDLNGNDRYDPGYLPQALAWAKSQAARVSEGTVGAWYDPLLRAVSESTGAKEGLLAGALAAVKAATGSVIDLLWNIEGFLLAAALAAFYLFFFLVSFDRMVEAVRLRLPGRYRPRIEGVAAKIDAAVSAFLRGRLLVCVLVGVLTAVGLAFLGVPYWYLLGVITGLAGIVPFLPIFVGMVPTVLVAWFDSQSAWVVGGTIVVFIVTQGLDGWVLTPFIQGRAVGLHPVTLTVALLVGWELLGVFGLIAAVPLAASIKILVREFVMPKVEALAREKPDP